MAQHRADHGYGLFQFRTKFGPDIFPPKPAPQIHPPIERGNIVPPPMITRKGRLGGPGGLIE
jgi:hypothetical protein